MISTFRSLQTLVRIKVRIVKCDSINFSIVTYIQKKKKKCIDLNQFNQFKLKSI